MKNKSKMRVLIVLPFFSILILRWVKGDIRDFIVQDESDLKRFDFEDSESLDDFDMYDSELDMYDSCYGGDSYENMISEGEGDSNDYSIGLLNNMLSKSQISLSQLKKVFRKLAEDPHYASLLKQVGGLEELYGTPSCQSDSYTDVFMNNHELY